MESNDPYASPLPVAPANQESRTLQVAKIVGILIPAALTLEVLHVLLVLTPKYGEIFETMVRGGVDALPELTKFVFFNNHSILAGTLVTVAATLFRAGRSKNLPSVLLLCGLTCVWLIVVTRIIGYALFLPLTKIITDFGG